MPVCLVHFVAAEREKTECPVRVSEVFYTQPTRGCRGVCGFLTPPPYSPLAKPCRERAGPIFNWDSPRTTRKTPERTLTRACVYASLLFCARVLFCGGDYILWFTFSPAGVKSSSFRSRSVDFRADDVLHRLAAGERREFPARTFRRACVSLSFVSFVTFCSSVTFSHSSLYALSGSESAAFCETRYCFPEVRERENMRRKKKERPSGVRSANSIKVK